MWTNNKISETLSLILEKYLYDDCVELQSTFLTSEYHKADYVESTFFYELIVVLVFCTKCTRMKVIPKGFFDYHLQHKIAEAFRIWYKDYFVRSPFSNNSGNLIAFFEQLKEIADDPYNNRQKLQIVIYRSHLSKMGVKLDDSISIPPRLSLRWKICDYFNNGFYKEALSHLDTFEQKFGSSEAVNYIRQLAAFKINPSVETFETIKLPEFRPLPSFVQLRNNITYIDLVSRCNNHGISSGHIVEIIQSKICDPVGEDDLTISYILPLWEHIKTVTRIIGTDEYVDYLHKLYEEKSDYMVVTLFCDYIDVKYRRTQNFKGICDIYYTHKEYITTDMMKSGIHVRLNTCYCLTCAFIQENRIHWLSHFQDTLDDLVKSEPFLSPCQQKIFSAVRMFVQSMKNTKAILERNGFLIVQEELEEGEDGKECLICFEPTKYSVIQCQNCENIVGHFGCISKWFKINLNCPLCRS